MKLSNSGESLDVRYRGVGDARTVEAEISHRNAIEVLEIVVRIFFTAGGSLQLQQVEAGDFRQRLQPSRIQSRLVADDPRQLAEIGHIFQPVAANGGLVQVERLKAVEVGQVFQVLVGAAELGANFHRADVAETDFGSQIVKGLQCAVVSEPNLLRQPTEKAVGKRRFAGFRVDQDLAHGRRFASHRDGLLAEGASVLSPA